MALIATAVPSRTAGAMEPWWRHRLGWAIVAVVIGTVVLAPLAYIGLSLLSPAGDGWRHIQEHLLGRYLQGTGAVVALTLTWATLFAVVPAWLVAAFQFPGRRALSWLLASPLAVPSYIAAIAWAGLLDFTGPVQTTLRSHFGNEVARLVPDIMNVWGVSFVLGSVLYPYVYVTTRAALLRQTATLIEAARCLGAGPGRAFVEVVLPTLRPAIVAGLALVLMESVNDYGAVHYYGVDTFTTGIFRSWLALGDVASAIRLAAVLLVVTALALSMERLARGRQRFDDAGTTRPLGRWQLSGARAWLATLACATPVLAGLIIPVSMLACWTISTHDTLVVSEFVALTARSVGLAATAAIVVVVGGVTLAYARRVKRTPWLAGITGLAGAGYAVPGAVIAVGVFALGAVLDGFAHRSGLVPVGTLFVGGSVGALIWAYGVRFLAVGLQPIDAGFARQGPVLDEAARTLGAGPLRTLLTVHAPLLRGSLAGAATLAFVDVLKELPLTLILRPFDFATLATHTYELASEEMVPASAPGALLLVGFGLVAVAVAQRGLLSGQES